MLLRHNLIRILLLFFIVQSIVPSYSQTQRKEDKRIALVIGINIVHSATVENDAMDIAFKLRSIGYKVMEAENISTAKMKKKIEVFCEKANDYDVALIFYTGTTFEIEDNYLPGIDCPLDVESPEQINNGVVKVSQVATYMGKKQ